MLRDEAMCESGEAMGSDAWMNADAWMEHDVWIDVDAWMNADAWMDASEGAEQQGSNNDNGRENGDDEWQDVDRELRSLARRQSGLDAELMRALREAERVRLWRHLGCVSMMEYLERVFGYSPRVAQERIRTARKLEELPELTAALEEHELSFSAVRELSRIATPATERAWRGEARGKSLREIEDMVSGRAEGDSPTSKRRPELETSRLSYDRVVPATRARERQLRQLLDAERGERLEDGAFIAAVFELAMSALTGNTGKGVADHAKYQIVVYRCKNCGEGKQLGAGVQFDLDEAALERAQCDAVHASAEAPGALTQDIPKAVRRFVDLRDGKRCRIPGCRSAACLELHHIRHRANGGTHDSENLISICDGHHDAHHRGVLFISGTSSKLIVRRIDETTDLLIPVTEPPAPEVPSNPLDVDAHVGAAPHRSRYEQAENRTMAITALKSMGWKPKTAGLAVDAAITDLGPQLSLEALIRAALQRCR